VVLGLRQAAQEGGANDAGAGHADGEAAAVRRVVGVAQSVVCHRLALERELAADAEARAQEALDDARLARDPVRIVRLRAVERGVEDDLLAREAPHLDGHAVVAGRARGREQREAERDAVLVAEGGEDEAPLGVRDGRELALEVGRRRHRLEAVGRTRFGMRTPVP